MPAPTIQLKRYEQIIFISFLISPVLDDIYDSEKVDQHLFPVLGSSPSYDELPAKVV